MAKAGQQVEVSYVGRFDDGEIFDSTESHGEPLVFVVGDGQIIPGFDRAVREMEVGDTRTVSIEPADAYGDYDSKLLHTYERAELGEWAEQLAEHVGESVYLQDKDDVREVTIVAADNEKITLDFNHRMAGKRLNFEITLESASDEVTLHTRPVKKPENPPKPGETR